MWSTLEGEPVVGELVGKGLKLKPLYCVTTTWGQWRELHPDTTVLSLETGHARDYGEGVAYKSYFSSPKVMFEVPKHDDRLKDKDQVLAIRLDDITDDALAIAADFLKSKPVYHDSLGDTEFVVLTDVSGANRVYETRGTKFESFDGKVAVDSEGNEWAVDEAKLTNRDSTLKRLPSHRAFWFGWFAQFPETRLVK